MFLETLEKTVGGPKIFEEFARVYFKTYAYKSLDSYEFKEYFEKYFKENKNIASIDWNKWLKGTGMPDYTPPKSKLKTQVLELLEKWKVSGYKGDKKDVEGWHIPQFEMFLDNLRMIIEKDLGLPVVKKDENSTIMTKEEWRTVVRQLATSYGFDTVCLSLFLGRSRAL